MTTLPIGSFLMVFVILYLMTGAKASDFINAHSFAIVVVGSVAVLAISTPWEELKALWKAIRFLFKKPRNDQQVFKDLGLLSADRKASISHSHPLISYAQTLWVKYGVDSELFTGLMKQKFAEENRFFETGVAVLRNLAKYPPALGMTGTVVGLVTVFASLDATDQSKIGLALAIALTATFYGLLLSNALIMPFADRLQVSHLHETRRNELIMKMLIMINNGEPIHHFTENADERK